jgi:hypothetical protein
LIHSNIALSLKSIAEQLDVAGNNLIKNISVRLPDQPISIIAGVVCRMFRKDDGGSDVRNGGQDPCDYHS